MKILFLSNEKHPGLIGFLSLRGEVEWKSEPLNKPKFLRNYDWIVSYGYRHIIPKSVLKSTKNPIINLHISYLPYNRGAHPNYWSIIDNTPKGVTIHFIDEGIDTGPILVQKKCYFDLEHTLRTSHSLLKSEIEMLFYKTFDNIVSNEIKPRPQTSIGTFHQKKDLPLNVNWDINIKNLTI